MKYSEIILILEGEKGKLALYKMLTHMDSHATCTWTLPRRLDYSEAKLRKVELINTSKKTEIFSFGFRNAHISVEPLGAAPPRRSFTHSSVTLTSFVDDVRCRRGCPASVVVSLAVRA